MINRSINKLSDGSRVLIRDFHTSSSVKFATLGVDAEKKRSLTTKDGSVYLDDGFGSIYRSDDQGNRIAVSWAGPFPELSDREIIEFYDILQRTFRQVRNSSDPVLLIQLTDISADAATGRIVEDITSQARHGVEAEEGDGLVYEHVVVSKSELVLSRTSIPSLSRVGDLIVCSDFSCIATTSSDATLSFTTTLENAAVLGNAQNTEELARLIPNHLCLHGSSGSPHPDLVFRSFDIMSSGDVRHQELAAKARTEPDLGLFISTPDENGKCHPSFITGTGIHLFGHFYSSVEDLLRVKCPPQGVWALVEPEFWAGSHESDSGREWGEELNGTFVPATISHLEQLGVSLGALGETIIEYMRDSGHDVRSDPVECASAWLELAPSYQDCPAPSL